MPKRRAVETRSGAPAPVSVPEPGERISDTPVVFPIDVPRNRPYAHTQPCSGRLPTGEACPRMAMFACRGGGLCCGTHAPALSRTRLPDDPRIAIARANDVWRHAATVAARAKRNAETHISGTVKMVMVKATALMPLKLGWQNVWIGGRPRERDRDDALVFPRLCPDNMGPVHHGQPGIIPAARLTNMRLANRVHADDVDDAGWPLASFWDRHRAVYEAETVRRAAIRGAACNVPMFSIWISEEGVAVRLTPIEARTKFFQLYEEVAMLDQSSGLETLRDMVERGTDIRIAYPPPARATRSVHEHFNDTSAPFPHEMAVYAMLTIETTSDYPWNK